MGNQCTTLIDANHFTGNSNGGAGAGVGGTMFSGNGSFLKEEQIYEKKYGHELQMVDTGNRQSPIDIDTSKVYMNHDLNHPSTRKPLLIRFPNIMTDLIIQNTGYGWKLDVPEMIAAKTELTGGPLKRHLYRLWQFHCHWGPNINVGSEHTVNKRSYAAELHFVHWNISLYNDPMVALSKPNGLSVVAVFIDIGYQLNEELEKVLKQIDSVQYKGDRKLLKESIDIGKLMPVNKSYWTYNGSLTTPPLFESVTWIIYTTPIYGTIEQIGKFRKLFYTSQLDRDLIEDAGTGGGGGGGGAGRHLLENYRHTQPLNGRIVKYVRDPNLRSSTQQHQNNQNNQHPNNNRNFVQRNNLVH